MRRARLACGWAFTTASACPPPTFLGRTFDPKPRPQLPVPTPSASNGPTLFCRGICAGQSSSQSPRAPSATEPHPNLCPRPTPQRTHPLRRRQGRCVRRAGLPDGAQGPRKYVQAGPGQWRLLHPPKQHRAAVSHTSRVVLSLENKARMAAAGGTQFTAASLPWQLARLSGVALQRVARQGRRCRRRSLGHGRPLPPRGLPDVYGPLPGGHHDDHRSQGTILV
jgi:hypothetical protein